MKKFIKIFSKLLLFLFVIVFNQLTVCADSYGEIETMPEEYGDFISSVDENTADMLPDGIFSGDADEIEAAAKELSDPRVVIEALCTALLSRIEGILPSLAMILCVVILSALVSSVAKGTSPAVASTAEICIRICSFSAILTFAMSRIETMENYFDRLFALVSSFAPLSAVMYAMGGNLTVAVSSSARVGIMLGVCEFFCTQTVMPVFVICLCLSITSALDVQGGGAGGNLGAILRKWYMIAFSFMMTLVTIALGMQSVLSARADSVAMKGIKLAIGSFIPISGGTVASSLGTFVAGVELLRSSVGVIGIFVIILLLIPALIELVLMRMVLSISGFCASYFGCHGESRLISELDTLYGYLEGVGIISAVVFIIMFAIFAGISAPI